MAEDALDKFIDEIIMLGDFSSVSEEVKLILATDLKEKLLNQVNRAIIDAMNDQQVEEFNNFLQEGQKNDEQVQRFVANFGIDSKIIAARAMLRFRSLYLQPSVEQEI